MTIKSSYFDGITYAAVDDVAPWAALLTDGVHGITGSNFQVLAHSPANLSVDIQLGTAIKNGYFIKSDSVVNVAIASNTSGYNRIDNIVLNVDTTNKATTIIAQQGTPSSSPTAPVPLSNQLVLAQVAVGNNVSVINAGNITDVRVNVDLFGSQLAAKANKITDFVSSNQLNGYQKIPSGLIIQWGYNYVYSTGTDITLPIAFPNYCAIVLCSMNDANNSAISVLSKSNTTIKLKQFWTGGNLPLSWIAIGY